MRIFFRIAVLFWKQRRQAALTYICLFAGAALSMAIPQLTGRAIDLALGASQTGLLVFTAMIFFRIAVCSGNSGGRQP